MSKDTPDLPLDWEERIAARVFRWWRTKRRVTPSPTTGEVALTSLEGHLHLIAQFFASQRLHLRAAEGSGGVRGNVVLLPAVMHAGPTAAANVELYTLRSAIDGTRIQLGVHNPTGDDLIDEAQILYEASRAIRWLAHHFDGFTRRLLTARQWLMGSTPNNQLSARAQAFAQLRHEALAGNPIDIPDVLAAHLRTLDNSGQALVPIPIWGGILTEADQATAMEIEEEEAAARRPITTELTAPNKDSVERVFDKPAEDAEVMPVHTFEKVEFLDPFNGIMRRLDGSDELEDHLESLDEVDLRHIIRGGEAAESIFHAELDGLSPIPDVQHVAPNEKGIRYPEWDQARNQYRPNWVTVYPSIAQLGDDSWAFERTEQLKPQYQILLAKMQRQRHARTWIERERDGDEVVLPAVIESYGDRRAGHVGDERVYRRNPRRRRSTTTTVLIDISLSSDAWVDNRRVLDVSRDAVLLLGEVASQLGDNLEVLAFASNTRNHCRVWTVKDYREPWKMGRRRLGCLTPTGYTRIGPAIRHATKRLHARVAENKLLLVITDGKPNDYDRYEGSHGIADVRQAVREAKRQSVRVHAVGLDPKAARSLATMFGVGHSDVLRNLPQLPEMLVAAYAKLL